MMETQVQANVVFTDDAYLKTRYSPRADIVAILTIDRKSVV